MKQRLLYIKGRLIKLSAWRRILLGAASERPNNTL